MRSSNLCERVILDWSFFLSPPWEVPIGGGGYSGQEYPILEFWQHFSPLGKTQHYRWSLTLMENISNIWQAVIVNKTLTTKRMHSSRMRTGRTLTVFRKLETPPGTRTPPPKIWSTPPQKKFGADTPPSPRKFGADTPPKIWSRHPPLWTEWHTLLKILPWPKLRFGR